MHLRNTIVLAVCLSLLGGLAMAQQQVRVTGVQIDELVELPVEMRLGLFIGDAPARELSSVRMVGGTFDLSTTSAVPDDRDLRALVSGSFPLAFMIGNEFTVSGQQDVRFATAWLQPYHDINASGAYEDLFDEWFFRAPPELTDPVGYFNMVYVTDDVVLRSTPAEFPLRRGWNLVVARVRGGALSYEVGTEVTDVVIYSYGTNRSFQNLGGGDGEDEGED